TPAAADPAAPGETADGYAAPLPDAAASDSPTQAIPEQTLPYGQPQFSPQEPVVGAAGQPGAYGRPAPEQPQQYGQPSPSPQGPYPGQQPYGQGYGQQYPVQPGTGTPPYGQFPAAASYASSQGAPYGQQYQGQPYPPGGQQYPGQSGQPYPGHQQYPGQPAYGQPGYGQGIPPQAPHGGPPQQPKNRLPLLVALGVGGLIIILIAVSALTRGSNPSTTPTAAATTGGPSSASAPPQAADAASAVRSYLEALASGDAATALSYAATPPIETSLLTDDVLAASLADAPISDITTTAGTGADHQTVTAAYTLGSTPVSTTFETSLVSGAWLLDDVAVPLPIDTSAVDGVDLTVNGTSYLGNANVFPGRYTVASADKWYTISGGTIDVVDTSTGADAAKVTAKLSSSGISAIRKAAQAKLDSCIAKHSLAPKGCGFSTWLPGKNKVRPATINWDVTGGSNAMKKLKPKLFAAGSATANVSVKTRVYCYSTNGIHWRGYSSIHSVYATLTDDKVSVTFGL
ncbi:MAG: hypothetical protein QM633_12380, partial [Propionicimonas sp.]